MKAECSAFVTTSQRRGSGRDCIGPLTFSSGALEAGVYSPIFLPYFLLHLRNTLIPEFVLLNQRLYTIDISYIVGHYVWVFRWKSELEVR